MKTSTATLEEVLHRPMKAQCKRASRAEQARREIARLAKLAEFRKKPEAPHQPMVGSPTTRTALFICAKLRGAQLIFLGTEISLKVAAKPQKPQEVK